MAKGGDWRVSVGSDGQYMLENTSKKNIKVPPFTVLHTSMNGSVTEKPGKIQVAHLTWKPTLKTVAFLSHAGTEASVPKTMKEIIEENAVDRIYQHGNCSKGVAPSSFKVLKTMHSLSPEDWAGATTSSTTKLQWLWSTKRDRARV